MGAIPTLTGTGYLFPLQTGNSGKFLTTNGSVLSWVTIGAGGGVTGSGTTNYLSKWTSGTALGNSLVFDNGTNVGIGTATPSGLVTIAQSVNSGTANVLYLSNTSQTGTTVAAINFINIDSTIKASINAAVFGNDFMTFNVGSNAERMRINASGNLLVNTTTDQGQKFQVNGDALIGGLLTITGSSALPVQTATYIRFASGFSSPDIGRMYIGDGTGWKFHMSKRISSTTTDLITFQDNGNVGIKNQSPSYTLDVNGGIYGKGITADSDGTIGNAIYGYGQVLSGSSTNALVQLDTTWNTTGNANAIELNVTNTASGSASKVMNLKVDLTSVFTVSKGGAIQTTAPTGYTAKPWKLGDATSGTITPDYYIRVEIDGQIYSIPALLGTP